MSETVDNEADLLRQKAEWIRQAAGIVASNRGIELDICLSAGRWASMWVDDFNGLMAIAQPATLEEVRDLAKAARQSSLDRADGIERYPTGLPSIRTFIAGKDIFCLAFGDEAEYARQLIEQSSHDS